MNTLNWRNSHIAAAKIYTGCFVENKFGKYRYYIYETVDRAFFLGLTTFNGSLPVRQKPKPIHPSLNAAKKCAELHYLEYLVFQRRITASK